MLKEKKGREYSMERLYSYLGITRQAIHQAEKAKKKASILEVEILTQVEKMRARHPRMGLRSMYFTLGISAMGINKFERLVSQYDLAVKVKRKRIITTDSKGSKRYPNRINGLILNDINQLIVSDITYYKIDKQDLYIFTLKDVYSQRVLSLTGTDNMRVLNALLTLADFKKLRGDGPFPNLIHHSDNGTQYDAHAYKNELTKMGITISRARNSLENGSSESLNDIIKNDYLFDRKKIKSLKDLKTALKKLKWKLNNEKAVPAIGYMTVVRFEKFILDMPEHQRPIKKLYDFEKEDRGHGLKFPNQTGVFKGINSRIAVSN